MEHHVLVPKNEAVALRRPPKPLTRNILALPSVERHWRHYIFRCDVCGSVKCSPKPGATGQSWSLTEGLLICRKCKKSPNTTPFGQEEEEAVDGVPFVVNSFIANSPSFDLCVNRMGLKFPRTVLKILQECKEAALLSPKLHCPWKHYRDPRSVRPWLHVEQQLHH